MPNGVKTFFSQAKKNLTFRDILPALGFLILFLGGVVGLLVFTFHIIQAGENMEFSEFMQLFSCSFAIGFGLNALVGYLGYIVKATLGIMNIK